MHGQNHIKFVYCHVQNPFTVELLEFYFYFVTTLIVAQYLWVYYNNAHLWYVYIFVGSCFK